MNLFKSFIFLISLSFSISIFADYIVETSSGNTDGYKTGRVINWDDIPYAKPPVEDLRWKAPRKIDNPNNLIISKEHNYCVQRPSSLGGPGGEGIFVGTEDCLYLDISAPVKNKSELLPKRVVQIYPSPSNNNAIIKTKSPGKILILNAIGEIIHSYDSKTEPIIINELSNGLHYVIFTDNNGRKHRAKWVNTN